MQSTARPVLTSTGTAWVEPIVPVRPRILKCSAVENICAQIYHSLVMFFRLPDDRDALSQYEYMRRGLRHALHQQDIFTGAIKLDERGAFSVAIPPAPHAGMTFRYCDLSRDDTFPGLDDLERDGFPYASGSRDGLAKLRHDSFPTSAEGSPVMVAQVAHIRGGLVLTTSFSHQVVDVVRSRAFLMQWAASTNDIKEADIAGHSFVPVPPRLPDSLTDTARLTPPPTAPSDLQTMKRRSKALPNFKLADPLDPAGVEADLQTLQPRCHLPPCDAKTEDYLREIVVGVWHFSRQDMMAIHSAIQHASPNTKLSVGDVLVAFLWSRNFVAKYPNDASKTSSGLYGDVPKNSTILSTIDVRRRLNPPLPPNFMGAAVDFLRVAVPSAALKDSADYPRGLARVASAMRQSNTTWDEAKYMTLLELVQQTPASPGLIPRGPFDLIVTDHRRFTGIVDSDWGLGLGQCVAFREPYICRTIPTGEITLMPGKTNGNVEVMIASERAVLQRMSMDPMMRRFSTCQFLLHDVVQRYRKQARQSARL